MAHFSRRRFISQLAGLPSLSVLPMLGSKTFMGITDGQTTIDFAIDFSGPIAFIDQGDWIYAFAPNTQAPHVPVVSSDSGELVLPDGNGYKVTYPRPKPSTGRFFIGDPPLIRSAPNAYSLANNHCRIGIQVPRPDLVKGVNSTQAQVDNASAVTLPTGLRFIYKSINTGTIPTIQSNGATFVPKFDADDSFWQLKVRMVPANVTDPCHAEEIQSFNEVATLCGVNPVPSISYNDPPPCPVNHVSPSTSHEPAARPTPASRPTPAARPAPAARPQILRGPGSDCQVLALWLSS